MVFADAFGRYFISYPLPIGWILGILVIGGTFAMVAVALVRRTIGGRDIAMGAGGAVSLLLGVATILMLSQRFMALLLSDIASPYALIGQFGWILGASLLLGLGVGALLVASAAGSNRRRLALFVGVAGAVAALLGDFSVIPLGFGVAAGLFTFASAGRSVPLPGWFAGATLLIGILALLLQLWLPNGAHALVWPLALLLPALALLLFAPGQAKRRVGLIAIALPAALLAGLMARTGYDFFTMIGATLPAVIAPFLLLTVVALAPVIWPLRNLGRAGILLVAAGLVLSMAGGIAGRTPSAASPELVEAFYIADIDDGSAQWASGKLDTGGWVKSMLAQGGDEPKLRSVAPLAKDDHWVAKAQPATFIRPGLEVTAAGNGNARLITVRASNANGGRFMRIYLKPSVDLSGLWLMGRPVPGTLKAGSWSQLIIHATGRDEVVLAMKANRAGALEVRIAEVRDGLPANSRSIPLPPHVIPYRRAGTSMIVTRKTATW
jgi:hypothetical protein